MEEKPIFIRTFGDSPVIRILNTLLTGRELDYSMSDIARVSNVSWSTLNRVWDGLIKSELIKQTRQIGKAKLFMLNMDHLVVKNLIKMYDVLLMNEIEKIDERVVVKEQDL